MTRSFPSAVACLAALMLGAASAACERERRTFADDPGRTGLDRTPMTRLVAGEPSPAPPPPSPYRRNAYAINEGKRLYTSFNCVGCHSHGGGGMGPPLMDDRWIYGREPANVFSTIVEGRPNGMPAWRGRIPEQQVWQLVAYVESMSGQVPIDALPGRDDHLAAAPPEIARPAATPAQTGSP